MHCLLQVIDQTVQLTAANDGSMKYINSQDYRDFDISKECQLYLPGLRSQQVKLSRILGNHSSSGYSR